MEVKLTKSSLITNPRKISNHNSMLKMSCEGRDMLLQNVQIEEQLLIFVMDIIQKMKIREKKKMREREIGVKESFRGMKKKGWMRR